MQKALGRMLQSPTENLLRIHNAEIICIKQDEDLKISGLKKKKKKEKEP